MRMTLGGVQASARLRRLGEIDEVHCVSPTLLPGQPGYIPVVTMLAGHRGAGKTLAMTMLGLVQQARYHAAGLKGWKLMANYAVQGADYCSPDIIDRLIAFDPAIRNATVLIDELPSLFSNRRSQSGVNRDFGVLIQQIRKLNIELIFTAQKPRTVDVQLRDQIDWYAIPELCGPGKNFLKVYWYDFDGQFIGNGHKYWPPTKQEADVVKVFGPLSLIYGKYRTEQVIGALWSPNRDDIEADWATGAIEQPVVTTPAQPPTAVNVDTITVTNIGEWLAQQDTNINIKDAWDSVQPFWPASQPQKIFREFLRQNGYQVPDRGKVAIRL
jgi:hypothetical protein